MPLRRLGLLRSAGSCTMLTNSARESMCPPLPVASGYDGWAVSYDGEDNGCFPMRDDVLTPMLDRLTPGRVLDAACGTGAVTQQLLARGHVVVGVDVSEGMLARARTAAPEAHLLAGDITDLPLPDEDVDHVVCSLALAHLDDLRPFFVEAARVMRPGGHLLVLDPRGHFTGSTRYPLVKEAPDGRVGHVSGYSHGLGDHLRAALPHGYVVRDCVETYRDADTVEPDETPEPLTPGPPDIRELHPWVREAANAAKAGRPAVVAWDFERTLTSENGAVSQHLADPEAVPCGCLSDLRQLRRLVRETARSDSRLVWGLASW